MADNDRHMNVDREYFESLYRQHYAAIMRFAARRTDEQSARDVTADTFLAAWRRLDTLPRSNELAWLYTTARNMLRDELRGRTRRSRLDARLQSQPSHSDTDVADRVTDRLHAQRLLDAPSPKDREALQLVEWEQLDIGTAEQVVGCTARHSGYGYTVPGAGWPHSANGPNAHRTNTKDPWRLYAQTRH